jgi:hypothetical protein
MLYRSKALKHGHCRGRTSSIDADRGDDGIWIYGLAGSFTIIAGKIASHQRHANFLPQQRLDRIWRFISSSGGDSIAACKDCPRDHCLLESADPSRPTVMHRSVMRRLISQSTIFSHLFIILLTDWLFNLNLINSMLVRIVWRIGTWRARLRCMDFATADARALQHGLRLYAT